MKKTQLTDLETMFLSNSWIDECGYLDSDLDYFRNPVWKGVVGSLTKKGVLWIEPRDDQGFENLFIVAEAYEDKVAYNNYEECY